MNYSLQPQGFFFKCFFEKWQKTLKMFILIPLDLGGYAEGEFRSGEIVSPDVCPDLVLEGMAESRWKGLSHQQVRKSDFLSRIHTSHHPDINSDNS